AGLLMNDVELADENGGAEGAVGLIVGGNLLLDVLRVSGDGGVAVAEESGVVVDRVHGIGPPVVLRLSKEAEVVEMTGEDHDVTGARESDSALAAINDRLKRGGGSARGLVQQIVSGDALAPGIACGNLPP